MARRLEENRGPEAMERATNRADGTLEEILAEARHDA